VRDARAWSLGVFIVLLPVSVEIPASSDSGDVGRGGETRVTVMGGAGHYALIDRGCYNEILATHPHEFREVAAEAQHRFGGGLTLGVRAGSLEDHSQERILDQTVYPPRESLAIRQVSNRYVSPWVGVEGKSMGAGIGWMNSEVPLGNQTQNWAGEFVPTFHLRFGSLDRVYFKISYLENLPMYSSGGLVDLGFGLHPFKRSDVYFGLGAGGPFDGFGVALRLEQRIADHLALSARGRLGGSGGESQSGLALGFTYVSTPPIDVERRSGPTVPMGSAWGLAPREKPKAKPPAPVDSLPPPE